MMDADGLHHILQLFISLLEHFGLIAAVAFLLLSVRGLRDIFSRDLTVTDQYVLAVFFGVFGILGTFAGDPIQGAFANLRAISVIAAGLVGGPFVGLGAGLIAGGHRFAIDIGGFTSAPCALATVIEGIAAGWCAWRFGKRAVNWRMAAVLGVLGESLHMAMVLMMAHPFGEALALVKVIAVPMILINSIGAGLLVEVIRTVIRGRELQASLQAKKAMTIANRTVSHLRAGLDERTAQATADIIFEETDVAAVAITDDRQLLGYAGKNRDAYQAGQRLRTQATLQVLESGTAVFARGETAVGYEVPHPMFRSAIIVPLKKAEQVIGTLKLYGDRKHRLTHFDFQIAVGLADLFSTQLELEDIQITANLIANAEIKRLQEQINPHFLFNALNTISCYCRTSTTQARDLLLELSNYLRRNVKDKRDFIPLSEELKQIKSFLAIEHARFGDRIRFELDIDAAADDWPLPRLIVQPLVENAVKHGISIKEAGGTIRVSAKPLDDRLVVRVADDGVGMPSEAVASVFSSDERRAADSPVGLRNVYERLQRIYGVAGRLDIETRPDHGTIIFLTIPMLESPVMSSGIDDTEPIAAGECVDARSL